MAVTDPTAKEYERMSMFIVPKETAGVEILRNMGVGTHESEGSHAYIRYSDVHVPKDSMLWTAGRRLRGRADAARRRTDTSCDAHDWPGAKGVRHDVRAGALARTQGSRLADKQMVQEKIADSWMEIEQFRLLVLRTAWKIDSLQRLSKGAARYRGGKALMPKVFHDVASRALFLHGSLGATGEMPFVEQVIQSSTWDSPTGRPRFTKLRSRARCCATTRRPTICSRRSTFQSCARRP